MDLYNIGDGMGDGWYSSSSSGLASSSGSDLPDSDVWTGITDSQGEVLTSARKDSHCPDSGDVVWGRSTWVSMLAKKVSHCSEMSLLLSDIVVDDKKARK